MKMVLMKNKSHSLKILMVLFEIKMDLFVVYLYFPINFLVVQEKRRNFVAE